MESALARHRAMHERCVGVNDIPYLSLETFYDCTYATLSYLCAAVPHTPHVTPAFIAHLAYQIRQHTGGGYHPATPPAGARS